MKDFLRKGFSALQMLVWTITKVAGEDIYG